MIKIVALILFGCIAMAAAVFLGGW